MRIRTIIRLAACLIFVVVLPRLCSAADIEALRKRAEGGDAQAECDLGIAYADGKDVPVDRHKAFKWLLKAAEHGVGKAQFRLASAYAEGSGVRQSTEEAVKWYRRAAEQGDPIIQSSVALTFESGLDIPIDLPEAVKWYQRAAEQGHALAQSTLGFMYEKGRGVPKDSAEAMKWFRRAAEQGNEEAQLQIGFRYIRGKGVPRDNAEGFRWVRSAAMLGHPVAQGYLCVIYSEGECVPRDETEALAWLYISTSSDKKHRVEHGTTLAHRAALEEKLGRQASLMAQRRSAELFREIEAAKAKRKEMNAVSQTLGSPRTDAPKASGTGAIVSTQGHVLTAAHVVAGASRISVVTAAGMKSATVLRVDEANDLAVLKIQDGSYSPLPVAQSRRVRLGQTVATIGFPNVDTQGFSPKLTKGEISSLNGVADDPRSWQVSVPVQPGNSGGPLLDEGGNLIGVIVAKLGPKTLAATGDIPQNVNYAVKSAYALALLEPYLGDSAPEPAPTYSNTGIEDMVAKAQQSVVLILVF